MNKKWALLKESAVGPMGRGQAGKQKVYEITINDTTVTFSWGMAEMPRRQTQTRTYRTTQGAYAAAMEKLAAKTAGGYRVAYAV